MRSEEGREGQRRLYEARECQRRSEEVRKVR
jgi:hypothetical protein